MPDYDYSMTQIDDGVTEHSSCPWFSQREKIKKVVIESGVTNIGEYAFCLFSNLTSVTIPNSVTSIAKNAFYISSPTSVTIGSLVEFVELRDYFSNTTSVTIIDGVTSIGYQAFRGCSGLTSLTIPNSVTSIGSSAFYGCSGLTSLTIPNSVTSIEYGAFSGCSGLTSLTIPNSVTSIASSAFSGCSGLTSLTIPNSVTSIGHYAFEGCSSLTSLTIPNSVTSIGNSAFKGCSGVKEIYSWNVVPPTCGDDAFGEMNTLHGKLFVPEGSADDYSFAKGWMNFMNIYEMEYTPVLSAADPITISDSKPSVTKGYYKEKTVTYVREGAAISKENYASFCLPFAVDPADAQFKAVYVPVGLSLYDTETNTLRIGFYQTNDIIPAGTPFLAQLAVDDKVEIKNALPVNYAPNAPAIKTSVVRTFNHSNSAGIMNENNDYAISFSGSYNKVSPDNGYTFNTDGSIGASANVVPFRAYFVIGKNASNAKIITSFDIDAETTGIGQLRMTNDDMTIYDINGRRVNEKSLKSGIYIKNGKKYVK